ncbi:MAG: hypothetical protein Q9180_006553, partial [Flavoplaca navasiana]
PAREREDSSDPSIRLQSPGTDAQKPGLEGLPASARDSEDVDIGTKIAGTAINARGEPRRSSRKRPAAEETPNPQKIIRATANDKDRDVADTEIIPFTPNSGSVASGNQRRKFDR